MRRLNFFLIMSVALSAFISPYALGVWHFTRSVNDGSAGNDVYVSDLNFSLEGYFTIAGWVEHATGNFNQSQHDVLIACWDGEDGEASVFIRGWGNANRGNVVLDIGGVEAETDTVRPFEGNTSETHVAIRRIGSTVTFWINGSVISTITLSGSSGPLQECWLGSWAWDYFQGDLAGWAIWTRGLSDAEIVSLAQYVAPECYRNGIVFAVPMIAFQELVQGGSVTNGTENNDGVTPVRHLRTLFCGE